MRGKRTEKVDYPDFRVLRPFCSECVFGETRYRLPQRDLVNPAHYYMRGRMFGNYLSRVQKQSKMVRKERA